jgi:small-conductance mechanosensitive channel
MQAQIWNDGGWMTDLFKDAVSLSLFTKCVAAIVGILLIHATFRVFERVLPRQFGQADARYKVRKFVIFAGYVVIILFLAILFEDRLGRISVTLGFVGAGVAVALQDVVASIAGAFSIGFSKLYTVGDRVQIGDTRGDVIDIGLLRTTLMETGNWVSKDLYNGRIVRIPNNIVLKVPVFNYSQGFRFIWDEIKVLLTTTSDCQLAREMLLRAAKEAIGEYLIEAQASWKAMSDYYRGANPPLDPTVALIVNGGSLEFTVSYVVDYAKRTATQDRLFSKIVVGVASSNGQLAWAPSGVTNINLPPTPDAASASPTSSPRGSAQTAGSH